MMRNLYFSFNSTWQHDLSQNTPRNGEKGNLGASPNSPGATYQPWKVDTVTHTLKETLGDNEPTSQFLVGLFASHPAHNPF